MLVLHLAFVGAWVPHVAALSAESPVTHVEAAGTRGCPPVHDETTCCLCQVATMLVLVASPIALDISDGRITARPAPRTSAIRNHRTISSRHSRAPPRTAS